MSVLFHLPSPLYFQLSTYKSPVVVYFWRNHPHREANAQEVYQNSRRTEAKASVVNGTGYELDQAMDSLQVMKTQMMCIAYASQGHQPPEDNGPNQVYINCELMLPKKMSFRHSGGKNM
ncbi:hypothetical protein F2Q69_00028211 [Brassica cretica]|uniref:Uncharacterized protein n=1 Tax=Brassica cretica TaxID=69181 RepID=A0A8S9RQF1_BRACR|nr:hypothetical protein F2Q69_00028211 [Brassica cretica]